MLAKYLDTKTYCPPGGYDISWSLRDKLFCLQLYWKAVDMEAVAASQAWSLAIMTTEDMIRNSHHEWEEPWQSRIRTFREKIHREATS